MRVTPPSPVLATPEQIAAETTLLRMLADPIMIAALDEQVARLADVEIACAPDGAARLAHAVRAWAGGLIMRWISGDPGKPAIILSTDNTPRHWRGVDIPATGAAGDNPDHVYRNSFVDGQGRYVIRGKIDPVRPPVQFSIEVSRGRPGVLAISSAASGSKVKNQIDLITDEQIVRDADGNFEIQVGGEASSANHLELAPEPVTLIVRDVLSDWAQTPTWLSLNRIDACAIQPFTYEALRATVLAELPGYLDFWTGFPLRWMGGISPNGFAAPVPRDGGWGYQAGVRYDLQPGQRILITMRQARARYLGIQVCDPWFLGPDGRHNITSLNTAQVIAHKDDRYTYVVSPEDPGIADWIDSGGIRAGLVVLRWQAVPPGEPVADYLIEVRLLDQAQLDHDYPDLPRLTASERDAQRHEHAAQYALRYQ